MALLERVSTLVRANLNDLIDKAEHPEKMIKQVILDMENQLLQVKTQVAISIADQHVLRNKLKENEENERQWVRRAEMALDKHDDALARGALGSGVRAEARLYAELPVPPTYYWIGRPSQQILEVGPRVGLGLAVVFPSP